MPGYCWLVQENFWEVRRCLQRSLRTIVHADNAPWRMHLDKLLVWRHQIRLVGLLSKAPTYAEEGGVKADSLGRRLNCSGSGGGDSGDGRLLSGRRQVVGLEWLCSSMQGACSARTARLRNVEQPDDRSSQDPRTSILADRLAALDSSTNRNLP